MTLMLKFFLVVILAMTANCFTLSAADKTEVYVGSRTGSNGIPFMQEYVGKRFQQIYMRELFPPSDRVRVDEFAFPVNPLTGLGILRTYVIVRMGTAKTVSRYFDLNLGDDSQVVWRGWIEANIDKEPHELKFEIRGRPFEFNSLMEDLIIDIEVHGVEGSFFGGFYFGAPGTVWRVYYPLDGSDAREEPAALDTRFSVKVK